MARVEKVRLLGDKVAVVAEVTAVLPKGTHEVRTKERDLIAVDVIGAHFRRQRPSGVQSSLVQRCPYRLHCQRLPRHMESPGNGVNECNRLISTVTFEPCDSAERWCYSHPMPNWLPTNNTSSHASSHLRKAKSKNLGCRFPKPGIHGCDARHKEPAHAGSFEILPNVCSCSGTRVRPDCDRNRYARQYLRHIGHQVNSPCKQRDGRFFLLVDERMAEVERHSFDQHDS